jgi:hypothetical protein
MRQCDYCQRSYEEDNEEDTTCGYMCFLAYEKYEYGVSEDIGSLLKGMAGRTCY